MTRPQKMPKFKTLRPLPLDDPLYKRGYLVGGTGRLLAMARSASPDSPIYQSGLRMNAIREALASMPPPPVPDGDGGEAESPTTSTTPPRPR